MKNTPKLTTATQITVTASILLDEYNLKLYHDEAKKLQAQYGSDKIGKTASMRKDRDHEVICATGDEYLQKIEEIIQIAHDIMDGKLLPDIFDRIGLKNGAFSENKRIPVFESGIKILMPLSGGLTEYYHTEELSLCITTKGKYERGIYHHYDRYDQTKTLDGTTARLAITTTDRKCNRNSILPLLDSDMRPNNRIDIKYLTRGEIKPGCIYLERDGKEYLFLGNIGIIKDGKIIRKRGRWTTIRHYVRISTAITDMIHKAESLEDFLKTYIASQVSTDKDTPYFNQADYKRFIKETGTPFIDERYPITTKWETWFKTKTAEDSFVIPVPDENGTRTVITTYAILV